MYSNQVAIPKIEKNVPVPLVNRKGQWTWAINMKVGDSFYLENRNYDTDKAVASFRAFGYTQNWKITSQKDTKGVRLWRVA
jgi:hypothetical protein